MPKSDLDDLRTANRKIYDLQQTVSKLQERLSELERRVESLEKNVRLKTR